MLGIPQQLTAAAGGLALALLVGGSLGGWAGYRLAAGACAQQQLDQALAYADGWQRAVADARADVEAESARRAETALRHAAAGAAARETRLKGIIHELQNAPRPECRWPAGRVRLLHAAADAANAFDAREQPADRVPDQLPAGTAAANR